MYKSQFLSLRHEYANICCLCQSGLMESEYVRCYLKGYQCHCTAIMWSVLVTHPGKFMSKSVSNGFVHIESLAQNVAEVRHRETFLVKPLLWSSSLEMKMSPNALLFLQE